MMSTDEILNWQVWVRQRAGAAANYVRAGGGSVSDASRMYVWVQDELGWPTPQHGFRRNDHA